MASSSSVSAQCARTAATLYTLADCDPGGGGGGFLPGLEMLWRRAAVEGATMPSAASAASGGGGGCMGTPAKAVPTPRGVEFPME